MHRHLDEKFSWIVNGNTLEPQAINNISSNGTKTNKKRDSSVWNGNGVTCLKVNYGRCNKNSTKHNIKKKT